MQAVELDLGESHLEVVGELGAGGFGSVYLGFDHHLDRWLAIKVLRSVDGVELQEAFRAEAKTHGQLSRHENVVTVHQVGFTPADNRPWIAMDYAEGGTLQDYLDSLDGGIPWDRAVTWLLPICDAVQSAHDRGILHRDVKPDNILLETSGKPLLTDFGIACLVDDAEQTPIASMAHAAPEMFRDEPRTEQSDVFSLGTTLYLLLTGEAPFGWSPEQRVLVGLDAPMPPLPNELDMPPWLSEVLVGALAPDPAERLRSPRELRDELEEGLAGRRVELPTIPRAPLTPPTRSSSAVLTPSGPPMLVAHPSALLTVGAGAAWAPSSFAPAVATPKSATWRWAALVVAGTAVAIMAVFGLAVIQLSGGNGEDGGNLSPEASAAAGDDPIVAVESAAPVEATAGSGLLADLSTAQTLELANLRSVSSLFESAPFEDELTGSLDPSQLASIPSLQAATSGAQPAGLVAGHRQGFTYFGHELESIVALFDDEVTATAHAASILDGSTPYVAPPGGPRYDGIEIMRSEPDTTVAVGTVSTVVVVVVITALEGDGDTDPFTVGMYGDVLRQRVGDVLAGRPPVAAWLAVKTSGYPFDQPGVVEALERAMNDERALEVLGGRIAVAASDTIAPVDFRDLRAAMVPDGGYDPSDVEALVELAPFTADDRWWCGQPPVAEFSGCQIFVETGQQLGGEEGLKVIEVFTTEPTFDAGAMVTEFMSDIDVWGSVAQLTPAEFGLHHLNGYYEALILPAS